MKTVKNFRSLEDTLVLIGSMSSKGSVNLERILKILSGKGRFLLVLILSLPFCLPIQVPGLSTPFGLLISLLGVRIVIDRHVWIPNRILQKKISSSFLKNVSKKGLWVVKKLKKFVHPRYLKMCHGPFAHYFNGILIIILGLILALPLPIPFSNVLSAVSIFLICFGILEDDGLFVIIGYVTSAVTMVAITAAGLLINHAL